MNNNHESTRCKARTKAGTPCRAAATEGGLCFLHAYPNKAAELGRIGGRKNRHVSPELPTSVPRIVTAEALRQTTSHLIEGVMAKSISPKIASSLAPLLSLLLRAIETTDLERRMRVLENRAARDQRGDNGGRTEKLDGNGSSHDKGPGSQEGE